MRRVLRAACWVLRGSLVMTVIGSGGCKSQDDAPTPWEIVQGTAALAASKALDPTTGGVLGDFPTRTGSLTVADDSSVTGWIRLVAGDTTFINGNVVNDGGLVMTLTGLTPVEYAIITDGGFPTTYALLSTATVSGGDVVGAHKVYWEFHR
ncbi:MAG: hypothetical protein ABJB33_05940 [Gemmatimonadota bacterium]